MNVQFEVNVKVILSHRQVHGVGDGEDDEVGSLVGRPLEDVVQNALLPENNKKYILVKPFQNKYFDAPHLAPFSHFFNVIANYVVDSHLVSGARF